MRPAGVPGSDGKTLVAYADNDGYVHLIDLNGTESIGWPVKNTGNVITGILAIDLENSGEYAIAYGTSDGKVNLLDLRGRPVDGFPVDLQSQLQFQPTVISLGGGNGNGMICATNNSKITVLRPDGTDLPGWPQLTGYPSGTVPVSGDVNGDGQADIIFASQDGRVHMYNLLGQEQEGWPFYMDARPVTGSPAIGVMDRNLQLPQIAIASIDSTVYLLNGDGSIAGTWRWPNRTDSRPYQPIIAETQSGPAVITTTYSGSLYAWDASGARLSGYPFTNPGGTIYPPVAGDLNGDGIFELIVIGPSGGAMAYQLASYPTGGCTWPLPLGDQQNSGSYGTGLLPIANVEQVSGEFSGPVTISYSISCSSSTGFSVSYSTDAGYTWHATVNYSESPGQIIWDSAKDLPSKDERRCLVRITPYSSSGPGESGTSGLLHIDNNQPPEIYMGNPESIEDFKFRLSYAVEDREGDVLQLQGQYSLDNGASWELMDLDRNSLEIEPWFYGEPVVWNAGSDIDIDDIGNVRLRIRAADADPGPWYFIDSLQTDSGRLPSAQIIAPTSEVSGNIQLGIRLSDQDQDSLDVAYEYSIDGGTEWLPATAIEAESAGITRYEFQIIWQSDVDLPGYDGSQVRMRALPYDLDTGIAVPSAPFHVDNNVLPAVSISSPSRYDVFKGDVPVSFTLSDNESDDLAVTLQYHIQGSDETWHTAEGLMTGGPFAGEAYSSTVHWNSSVDLPEVTMFNIDIRLIASDGDSVISDVTGPITLENTNLPEVIRAVFANIDYDREQIETAFELSDREERVIDLAVHFSIDGGGTWHQATVSGTVAGLYSGSYENKFTWLYGNDLPENRGAVQLRITPVFEGDQLGRPRFIEQVFR